MQRPKSGSPKKFQITGKLIVVEGIDGSGKSTQLHLLDRWLRGRGLPVFTTVWNSSQIVREITSKGKRKGLLTPTTFSLLHATDFADRYERNILPLLRGGYLDRKSTRLNSSHSQISYAVFCLQKKTHRIITHTNLS